MSAAMLHSHFCAHTIIYKIIREDFIYFSPKIFLFFNYSSILVAIPPRGYGPRFQTSAGDLLFRRELLCATELSGEDVLDAGRRVELRVSGL